MIEEKISNILMLIDKSDIDYEEKDSKNRRGQTTT